MSTRWRIASVALVAVALAAAGCGGGDEESAGTEDTTTEPVAAGSTLRAGVGPGFEISLETEDGTAVSTLSAGEYTIEVDDQADIHNFHLTGPGVDEDSGVSETGTSTWTVTFEAGSYEFVCDPHASQLNGSFEVTG